MLITFAIAFSKSPKTSKYTGNAGFISIIIAFRNEEDNLNDLIESLLVQDYINKYEIILVNDHSTDCSIEIIKRYNESQIKLLYLPKNEQGKKAALKYGVSKSCGSILLFTDADCIVPKDWITNMTNYLVKEKVDMLCGPVIFKKSKYLLNALFRLEFISLTGSGAAGFFIGKPFLCNGANYAITRTAYLNSILAINNNYSSGDDIFLLQNISKNGKVAFYKNSDLTVKTKAPENIKQFFEQRIRWASKTTGYKDSFSLIVAILTFSMSAIMIILLIGLFFDNKFWPLFLYSISLKTIIDFILLLPLCKFYKTPKLSLLVPLLQLFYIFYVSITAILSLFYKPNWKGRRIS